MAWAKAVDLAGLRRQTAAEVLGVPPASVALVDAAFPHYASGHDREGRRAC